MGKVSHCQEFCLDAGPECDLLFHFSQLIPPYFFTVSLPKLCLSLESKSLSFIQVQISESTLLLLKDNPYELLPCLPWGASSAQSLPELPSPMAISSKILFPSPFLIPNRDASCWLGAPQSSNSWLDWSIYSQESIRVCNNQMRRAREALPASPSMASTGSHSGFKCGPHYKVPGCTAASFSGKVSTKTERETGIIWYHMSGNSLQMENGEERHTDVFSSKLLGNN